MDNKQEPAFPLIEANDTKFSTSLGLTKREYIAAMALQGLMSLQDKGNFNTFFEAYEAMSQHAIMAADALLSELEKQ